MLTEAERWCAGHRVAVVLTLIALSLAVRLVYFVEIARSPCVTQHRWDQSDMQTYDRWARNLAAGDWLTDREFHPLHSWHFHVAEGVDALRGSTSPTDRQTAERRWMRWFGGKTLHAEPLYPYLIGVSYTLFGPEPTVVLVGQLFVGVVLNLLLWAVSRRLFGDLVAAVTAALALACAPLLFYEMVLLRTTAIACCGPALVWLWLVVRERGGAAAWGALGLAFGAAVALKTVFAIFFLGCLAETLRRGVRQPRELAWAVLPLLLGVSTALAPVFVRNVSVGAPLAALSAINAPTFVKANASNYDARRNAWDLEAVAQIMDRTDGRFLPTVVQTLRTHEGWFGYPRLLLSKFGALASRHEMPNNVSFYYYRVYSRTLRWLPVTFAVVGPLALIGLFAARRRLAAAAPLYLLVATHLVVWFVALNQSRYRAPLTAALLPFAALAAVELVRSLADGRHKRLLLFSGGLALGSVLAWWPLPYDAPLVRDADVLAQVDWELREHGADAARQHLRQVLERVPGQPGILSTLGDLELRDGDLSSAIDYYERALESQPDYRFALGRLIDVHQESGEHERARRYADRLAALEHGQM